MSAGQVVDTETGEVLESEVKAHPVAGIFPMMSESEFEGLVEDIKANGLQVPVWLHGDGRIIDGRNRYQACLKLGIKVSEASGTARVYDGPEDELLIFVVSLNLHRRHLDSDQRAMVGARIATLPRGGDRGNQHTGGKAEISALPQADAAGLLKVSPDSIQSARQVLASGDEELIREAEKGRKEGGLSISAAAAAARLDTEKRREFLSQAERNRTARAAQQMRRDEAEARQMVARLREPEPVTEPVGAPSGQDGDGYRCFVIDPPWPMRKIEREERPDQGPALDYPTLAVWCQKEERYDFEPFDRYPCWHDWDDPDESYEPCDSIECIVAKVLNGDGADNCHMYLWVTHRFLPDGLRLLNTWGFSYQCVMTWRKNVGITPFSWMYDTEHVLFGRRGNLPLKRNGLRLSFEAPVAGHSIKPDIFYDRVREASPGPRLDMFPGIQHDGFWAWGLEASHRAVV